MIVSYLKKYFQPISKAFDDFLPLLKDAALMARESVKACTIFSQWSREFGVSILGIVRHNVKNIFQSKEICCNIFDVILKKFIRFFKFCNIFLYAVWFPDICCIRLLCKTTKKQC